MRAKFPDLEIGLKIKAKFIVDFFSSCDRIECKHYNEINIKLYIIDDYFIHLMNANDYHLFPFPIKL